MRKRNMPADKDTAGTFLFLQDFRLRMGQLLVPASNMEITAASLLDLTSLQKVERACFEKDVWPLLDLIAVLTFADVVRLKAVDDGQMIGFVAGDPRPSEGFSWIATIGVMPDYRRRGVGRELLHACEAKLKTPRVRLSVRASNDGAIRLYEQEGYRRVEVWQNYYNDGEAAIVMEKQREPQSR